METGLGPLSRGQNTPFLGVLTPLGGGGGPGTPTSKGVQRVPNGSKWVPKVVIFGPKVVILGPKNGHFLVQNGSETTQF